MVIKRKLLTGMTILKNISIEDFDNAVLLCSEPTAEQCHRRLMAEYLKNNFKNISIRHL